MSQSPQNPGRPLARPFFGQAGKRPVLSPGGRGLGVPYAGQATPSATALVTEPPSALEVADLLDRRPTPESLDIPDTEQLATTGVDLEPVVPLTEAQVAGDLPPVVSEVALEEGIDVQALNVPAAASDVVAAPEDAVIGAEAFLQAEAEVVQAEIEAEVAPVPGEVAELREAAEDDAASLDLTASVAAFDVTDPLDVTESGQSPTAETDDLPPEPDSVLEHSVAQWEAAPTVDADPEEWSGTESWSEPRLDLIAAAETSADAIEQEEAEPLESLVLEPFDHRSGGALAVTVDAAPNVLEALVAATDAQAQAVEVLERLARQVRNGELAVAPASGASAESVLASILASLLSRRD